MATIPTGRLNAEQQREQQQRERPPDLTVPVWNGRWVCPFCEAVIPHNRLAAIPKPPAFVTGEDRSGELNDIIRCGMCSQYFSPRPDISLSITGEPTDVDLPVVAVDGLVCPWENHVIPRSKLVPARVPAKYASVLNPIFRCGMCGRPFSPRRSAVVVLRG